MSIASEKAKLKERMSKERFSDKDKFGFDICKFCKESRGDCFCGDNAKMELKTIEKCEKLVADAVQEMIREVSDCIRDNLSSVKEKPRDRQKEYLLKDIIPANNQLSCQRSILKAFLSKLGVKQDD